MTSGTVRLFVIQHNLFPQNQEQRVEAYIPGVCLHTFTRSSSLLRTACTYMHCPLRPAAAFVGRRLARTFALFFVVLYVRCKHISSEVLISALLFYSFAACFASQ